MKKKLKRRGRRGIATCEVPYKAPVIETAGWCRGRQVSQRKRKRLRGRLENPGAGISRRRHVKPVRKGLPVNGVGRLVSLAHGKIIKNVDFCLKLATT